MEFNIRKQSVLVLPPPPPPKPTTKITKQKITVVIKNKSKLQQQKIFVLKYFLLFFLFNRVAHAIEFREHTKMRMPIYISIEYVLLSSSRQLRWITNHFQSIVSTTQNHTRITQLYIHFQIYIHVCGYL